STLKSNGATQPDRSSRPHLNSPPAGTPWCSETLIRPNSPPFPEASADENTCFQHHCSVLSSQKSETAAGCTVVFHDPYDRVEHSWPHRSRLRAIARGGLRQPGQRHRHSTFSGMGGRASEEPRGAFRRRLGEFFEFAPPCPDPWFRLLDAALSERAPLAHCSRGRFLYRLQGAHPRTGRRRTDPAHLQSFEPRSRA